MYSSGITLMTNNRRHRALNRIGSGIDLDDYRSFYIVPRALCGETSVKDIYIDIACPLNYTIYILDDEKIENECSDCAYSENCDGQMCFFSMI